MSVRARRRAEEIAAMVTGNLGGRGLFGVELFVRGDEVWFSEISPRPHDTGLVTLCSQRFSNSSFTPARFSACQWMCACVSRAPGGDLRRCRRHGHRLRGRAEALAVPRSDLRLFGKPEAFARRRMGVAVANADDVAEARRRASLAASLCTTRSRLSASHENRSSGVQVGRAPRRRRGRVCVFRQRGSEPARAGRDQDQLVLVDGAAGKGERRRWRSRGSGGGSVFGLGVSVDLGRCLEAVSGGSRPSTACDRRRTDGVGARRWRSARKWSLCCADASTTVRWHGRSDLRWVASLSSVAR